MITSFLRWRRQGRRLGISLLFVIAGTGLWQFQERQYRDDYTWMGVPTWDSLTPVSLHRVLRNDGYLVGWSDVARGRAVGELSASRRGG